LTIQNGPELGSASMHSDPLELSKNKFWSWNVAYKYYELLCA
jgi:hypothetical protein